MDTSQLYKIRHSLAHILAMAALEVVPDAKLAIGPPIDNGFYYDFDLPSSLTSEQLKELQKKMRSLLAKDISFVQSNHTIAEALEFFKDQPFKKELIEDLAKNGETEVGYYTSGGFTDLCKGPHVISSKEIPADAFELTHVAGAYWRGDEKRPMLQRVYALAFENKAELDAYKNMLEEAKKRDHRKLGAELDLFTFSELVGSGLPLWTPKGTILRNLLDGFVWELRSGYDYDKVEIPHITKKDLYIKSGHWDKFQHELFRITTREGHEFAMKPMNCPHHTQIFARKKWSYRDMPQRYANTTTCYRDEQTGELNGLSRVRAFTQDDAHVFCRYDQAKDEVLKIWDVIERFYKAFGFDLKIRLSFHDPAKMGSYLGTEAEWTRDEEQLKAIVDEKGADYFIGVGEAAFYGPKIDFMASDSLGRQWQVATIQQDKNLPGRFELTYTGEDGTEQPVIMIHAAIMGSIDRFLSILIEHLAGNFPFWLSPVQVVILPVSEQFIPQAQEIARELKGIGLRVEVDSSNESVGKKIRNASLQKTPSKIVLGQQEVDEREKIGSWNVKINWRQDLVSQGEEAKSLSDWKALFSSLVREKTR